MSELAALKLLADGGGQSWVTPALLVCLFLALLFKPERIRNRALFRLACLLFGFSIMGPPLMHVGIGLLLGDVGALFSAGAIRGGVSDTVRLFLSLHQVLGPILLGSSLICGLLCMCPGANEGQSSEPSRSEPVRHPLER